MAMWGDPLPERPLKWTVFDYAVIAAAFVFIVISGVIFP